LLRRSIVANEKIILYPGTFCPPTIGHGDLVIRAARRFDTVLWAIGVNPAKECFLSVEERMDMLNHITEESRRSGTTNVKVVSFEGPAIRYAEKVGAAFILRGLRNTSDLQLELEMATANRGISKQIETVCMFSKPHYATISSSIVREVAFLGEEIGQYVHPYVARKIIDKVRLIEADRAASVDG
jgi:pantetheine-phosphate adenylyltransferase